MASHGTQNTSMAKNGTGVKPRTRKPASTAARPGITTARAHLLNIAKGTAPSNSTLPAARSRHNQPCPESHSATGTGSPLV